MFGKGTEFFPESEPRRAYIHIKAPEGTYLDASDNLVAQAEEIVSKYEDIRYVVSNIGSLGGDPFSQGGTGTHINRVALNFKDFHERSVPSSEIVKEIRGKALNANRGAEVQVEKEEEGPPAHGNRYQLRLSQTGLGYRRRIIPVVGSHGSGRHFRLGYGHRADAGGVACPVLPCQQPESRTQDNKHKMSPAKPSLGQYLA